MMNLKELIEKLKKASRDARQIAKALDFGLPNKQIDFDFEKAEIHAIHKLMAQQATLPFLKEWWVNKETGGIVSISGVRDGKILLAYSNISAWYDRKDFLKKFRLCTVAEFNKAVLGEETVEANPAPKKEEKVVEKVIKKEFFQNIKKDGSCDYSIGNGVDDTANFVCSYTHWVEEMQKAAKEKNSVNTVTTLFDYKRPTDFSKQYNACGVRLSINGVLVGADLYNLELEKFMENNKKEEK